MRIGLRMIVLLLFFLSSFWLTAGVTTVNSPDENANLLFAQEFSRTGFPLLASASSEAWAARVHPRSMMVVDGAIVPKSFFGIMVVYGSIGATFGEAVIPFLTPFFAVLAVLAWWSLVRTIFKQEDLADISALFLLAHPAFWYYTARTMMHNVGFLAFLLFGAWFLVRQPGRGWFNAFMAGAMVGLALAFRTSEIIWVAISAGALLFLLRDQFTFKWTPLVFGVGVGLVLLPFAWLNQEVYGAWWSVGYTAEAQSSAGEVVEEVQETVAEERGGILSAAFGILFPFGVHERAILRHVYQYGFLLYPWMSMLSAMGLFLAAGRWKDRRWKIFLVLTLALSAWLAVVYGSWSFHDNPDPNVITIGNSYVRYWLPLFTLASLFAGMAVLWMKNGIQTPWLRRIMLSVLCLLPVLLSAHVVFQEADGFFATRAALHEFEEKREAILLATEKDSVIIVDRADKYLFPHRQVIVPLRDASTYAAMPLIAEDVPLYYFGITFPPEDMMYLNEEKLAEQGLRIEPVLEIGEETLYRISYE